MMFFLLAVAGGLGAILRHVLGVLVTASGRPGWAGTVGVNALGSFAVGVVSGSPLLDPELGVILGTGLLGGFTTFSTASVDVVRLVEDGRPGRAAAVASGMLVLCLLCAGVGWALGRLAA